MLEYKVVIGSSSESSFVNEISESLLKGWVLQGGISHVFFEEPGQDITGTMVFSQALVRRVEESNK